MCISKRTGKCQNLEFYHSFAFTSQQVALNVQLLTKLTDILLRFTCRGRLDIPDFSYFFRSEVPTVGCQSHFSTLPTIYHPSQTPCRRGGTAVDLCQRNCTFSLVSGFSLTDRVVYLYFHEIHRAILYFTISCGFMFQGSFCIMFFSHSYLLEMCVFHAGTTGSTLIFPCHDLPPPCQLPFATKY